MYLPHSDQNVQPGFYFYPSKDKKSHNLLRIETKNVFFYRVNKSWQPYMFTKEFWEDPSDNAIIMQDIQKATDLVDSKEIAGESITAAEVANFVVMY
jgi:hypothetical protein